MQGDISRCTSAFLFVPAPDSKYRSSSRAWHLILLATHLTISVPLIALARRSASISSSRGRLSRPCRRKSSLPPLSSLSPASWAFTLPLCTAPCQQRHPLGGKPLTPHPGAGQRRPLLPKHACGEVRGETSSSCSACLAGAIAPRNKTRHSEFKGRSMRAPDADAQASYCYFGM